MQAEAVCSASGESLKERELLLSFPHSCPAHRSAGILARLGTIILEHKVIWKQSPHRQSKIGGNLFLNVGNEEKHLSCLKHCYFGLLSLQPKPNSNEFKSIAVHKAPRAVLSTEYRFKQWWLILMFFSPHSIGGRRQRPHPLSSKGLVSFSHWNPGICIKVKAQLSSSSSALIPLLCYLSAYLFHHLPHAPQQT